MISYMLSYRARFQMNASMQDSSFQVTSKALTATVKPFSDDQLELLVTVEGT